MHIKKFEDFFLGYLPNYHLLSPLTLDETVKPYVRGTINLLLEVMFFCLSFCEILTEVVENTSHIIALLYLIFLGNFLWYFLSQPWVTQIKNICVRLLKNRAFISYVSGDKYLKKVYKEEILGGYQWTREPGLYPREGHNLDTDVQKALSWFWKAAKLMLLYSKPPRPKITCDSGFE